jgi:hypothetical protein
MMSVRHEYFKNLQSCIQNFPVNASILMRLPWGARSAFWQPGISAVDFDISEMDTAQVEGITVELPNSIRASSAHRKTAESALKNANALADKLGLSPAARHRIKGAGAFQDATPKTSPILEAMKGGIRRLG